jgi:hypothetical protein
MTGDTFEVSQDDLVALARVASKSKLARDAIHDRDDSIAAAVIDGGVDPSAVARAAGLAPTEIATIVFDQEANPSAQAQLRRVGRAGQLS